MHVRTAVVGMSGEGQRARLVGGFLCSVLLHGLMVLPLVLMLDRVATTLVIPVDVVVLADQSAGPPPPDTASAPQKEPDATASPAAVPLGTAPSDEHPDELERKLQRLAKLRQPGPDTPPS